jgi:uncharacterized protein (DUF433 family)
MVVGGKAFLRITSDITKMGGEPCIRGLPITVAMLLNMLADGMTQQEIIAAFPDLTPEDIAEALRFAAELVRNAARPGLPGGTKLDWAKVKFDIEKLRKFDGDPESRPSETVIAGALRLAKSLATLNCTPPQAVVAGVNGTIYLEWNDAEAYQEIEINGGYTSEWRCVDKRTGTVSSCQLIWR